MSLMTASHFVALTCSTPRSFRGLHLRLCRPRCLPPSNSWQFMLCNRVHYVLSGPLRCYLPSCWAAGRSLGKMRGHEPRRSSEPTNPYTFMDAV